MKLLDIIIFSLAVAFLIIGIHQIMTVGFASAYWMIMLVTILFFIYSYRKRKEE
jgi:predicted membrane protein